MPKDAIVIEGDPIPKRRPKISRRGKHVFMYSTQKKEEGSFALEYLGNDGRVFKEKNIPIILKLVFYIKRPKSHYKTGRNSHLLKEKAPIVHTVKPDLDNLVKFVCDALNGIVWYDDKQIWSIQASKVYSDNPRTEICVKADKGGL